MKRPTLKERVAALEQWTELHLQETHRLEAKALSLATESLHDRMRELNDVRTRFVSKEWFEKIHSILEDRVRELEKAKNANTGERNLLKYLWQAILFGLGWLVHSLWK
jgi:hypothetical protein